MRTIGYRSNVLFILAAAFGLLAALGRPWYAASPVAAVAEPADLVDLPVESFFSQLWREITARGGVEGWDAFTSTDRILVGLLGIAVISALAALVPEMEQIAREVLRFVTLAMLGIVVVKLVNTPDAAGLAERRQGAWIALGVTGIMASSAWTLYAAPPTRRRLGRSLVEPPPCAVPPRSHAFDSPDAYVPPVDR